MEQNVYGQKDGLISDISLMRKALLNSLQLSKKLENIGKTNLYHFDNGLIQQTTN